MDDPHVVLGDVQMPGQARQKAPVAFVQLVRQSIVGRAEAGSPLAGAPRPAHLEQALFVIAQNPSRPGLAKDAQHAGTVRSASDQISDENESIRLAERQRLEEFGQLRRAAVNISDENSATHMRQVTQLVVPVKTHSGGNRQVLRDGVFRYPSETPRTHQCWRNDRATLEKTQAIRPERRENPDPGTKRTLGGYSCAGTSACDGFGFGVSRATPEPGGSALMHNAPFHKTQTPSSPLSSTCSRLTSRWLSGAAVGLGLLALASGCGNEESKYEPKPAYTGDKVSLPGVGQVPQKPIMQGEAYTVWGASYHLRSPVYHDSINDKDIKLTGYIVKTNMPDAPECAVHETGKADPDNCNAPIPTIWLGDSKDAPIEETIRVMGWASNFAQLYDAIKEYKKREKSKKTDEEPLQDAFWGVALPNPLPVKGAKVTIKGSYSTTFTKATSGVVGDPVMGVLTFDSIEYHEKPEELASLPGMKP